MKTQPHLSFVELFTLLLTVWTGLIYALLLSLHFSRHMVSHAVLQMIVFGPGAILLSGFLLYELVIHRRQ